MSSSPAARAATAAVAAAERRSAQSTPPPSPARFSLLAMSDDHDDQDAAGPASESDARSDDSDYLPGQSRTKAAARTPKSRKRLRQSSSRSASRKTKKAQKQPWKRSMRDDSADGDDDETLDASDSSDDTLSQRASESPTRSGKITGAKTLKRGAKTWVDDGCAATFAARIDAFKRSVARSVRDGTASFYNKPRAAAQSREDAAADTADDDDNDDDELDDGAFHDEAVAMDDTADAAPDATPQWYTPSDVTETASGLTVPTYMYAHLYPHQTECLEWLHHLHERNTGGILGDEMGLGKTVQIAAFLGAMHHARRVRTVLLLCPASVLLQWVREFHKWYPLLRVVLLHGSGSGVTLAGRTYSQLIQEVLDDREEEREDGGAGGGVIISTYENVRQYQELFLDVDWDYVVLDEGHRIRNPDAEITLVCKQFKTVHRIVLTGTPIQNRLRELWSLFDFVFPGKLGTLPTFDDEFVLPIRTGGYANASKMQVVMAYKCAVVLKDVITPYLLRRTKKEIQHVTHMPEKMEQILFCTLTPRQRSAYATFLQSPEVAAVLRRDIRPFRAIAILRHICNHPDLLETIGDRSLSAGALSAMDTAEGDNDDGDDERAYGAPERSGKMRVLGKILALWKAQQHRVLLFTQTRKMLDILERIMARLGYCYCRLDGTTSVKERQTLLDAFNADGSEIFIFLLTTRAGGIGVNLTGADRVVIFDPDWNPSTDLQARERSWRLGQTKPVTIYRLITSGTIEEKIYHRQIFKQYLTSKVLHDAKRKRCFNKHTLRDLFVLGADTDDTETTDLFLDGNVANPALAQTRDAEDAAGRDGAQAADDEDGDGNDRDDSVASADDDADAMASPTDGGAATGDNDAILQQLFDSDGLRGVFNHDVVERDGVENQEADLIDMESSKIAKSALSALRASCALIREQRESLFTPTWTGRSGTAGDPSQHTGGRFGNRVARGRQATSTSAAAPSSASLLSQSAGRGRGGSGGSSVLNSAPSSRNPFAQKALSSREMLTRIKMRKHGVASSASSAGPRLTNGFMGVDEMTKQLHAFLTPSTTDPRRRRGVTTEAILEAFASMIAPKDKLVFRNLLRDMAECRDRKWTLKSEFVTEP